MSGGLIDWAREALEPLGVVSVRKMFGGAGVYLDGFFFAMIAADEIWIKADAVTDAVFDVAGLDRFTYDFGGGKTGTMNYRRLPSDAYDDAEVLQHWARLGIEAAARAPDKKPKARR